jgi:hypothetical protein
MAMTRNNQPAHNSRLPRRFSFHASWINSVKRSFSNCGLLKKYNRLVAADTYKQLQHFQIAGNSLELLLPSDEQNHHGHGNTVGYGKNAKDWIIRSQASKHPMSWMMRKVQRVDGNGDGDPDKIDDVHKVYSNRVAKVILPLWGWPIAIKWSYDRYLMISFSDILKNNNLLIAQVVSQNVT